MDMIPVNQFEVTTVCSPAPWLIEAAADAGLDVSALEHEMTNYFVNHTVNRHGNEKAERDQGQLPITKADISSIPDIVKSPDYAIIGIRRHGETLIAYCKHFENWTTIYLEEVLNSRKNKALRSTTMYKKQGIVDQETFIKIVSNNAHTDMTKSKAVVGAGGNPDEEAEQVIARW
ncbi:MAG: hypothetical protein LBB83_04300 [Treponema sp.]|jgi:hypothetical protein|nr:hypothetical protein [Treponema sp.]